MHFKKASVFILLGLFFVACNHESVPRHQSAIPDSETRPAAENIVTEKSEESETSRYSDRHFELQTQIGSGDEGKIVENTSMKHLLSQLDSEVFIFDCVNELDEVPEGAAEGITVRKIDSHSLEVSVGKSIGINDIFGFLTAKGIQVSSMRNKTNRLEQLFLSKLRD